jgi:hypothetical protein
MKVTKKGIRKLRMGGVRLMVVTLMVLDLMVAVISARALNLAPLLHAIPFTVFFIYYSLFWVLWVFTCLKLYHLSSDLENDIRQVFHYLRIRL